MIQLKALKQNLEELVRRGDMDAKTAFEIYENEVFRHQLKRGQSWTGQSLLGE